MSDQQQTPNNVTPIGKGFRQVKQPTRAELESDLKQGLEATTGMTELLRQGIVLLNAQVKKQEGVLQSYMEGLALLELRLVALISILLDKKIVEDPELTSELNKQIMIVEEQREIQFDKSFNIRNAADDKEAKKGDIAIISYDGKLEDGTEADLKCTWQRVSIGHNDDGFNRAVEEMEVALIGMKKGETKDVLVSFADNYEDKKFAGKKASFKLTLLTLKEKIPQTQDQPSDTETDDHQTSQPDTDIIVNHDEVSSLPETEAPQAS